MGRVDKNIGFRRNIYREWMDAAAGLTAHPAEELPYDDLVRLPELFPFRFAVGVDQLRKSPQFGVHRQGAGWDMVRLTPGICAELAKNTNRDYYNRDS